MLKEGARFRPSLNTAPADVHTPLLRAGPDDVRGSNTPSHATTTLS